MHKVKALALSSVLHSRLEVFLLGALMALSIISFIVFSRLNLVLAYNDSMSHLNLTRLIIDNREPGIAQLGGVWLPLNHILPLIFIWNDLAWQSGFAGSIFSMAAFVLSAVLAFKTVKLLTGSKAGAFIAALTLALNLNFLYLQSTPLTEPLYVLFFMASVYFILKWVMTSNVKYLPLIGFAGMFQVLTRYDGWFVACAELAILFLLEFVYNKKSLMESFSKVLLVSVPIIFGIGMWISWNSLIYGYPLFFAYGPYSAHAQQEVIKSVGELITKGNVELSFQAYLFTVFHNVGSLVMALALFGSIIFLFLKNNLPSLGVKLLISLLFLSPVVFNILALYLGFSIINVPELNWNPEADSSGHWFNVRYGLLALPAIALWVGILSSRKVFLALICALAIFLQMFMTYKEGIITVVDGTIGSSAFRKQDVTDFLKENVDQNETVLLSIGFNNPIAFKMGVPLKNIIHEGVSKQWNSALQEPEKFADWIVVSNTQNGDPLFDAFIKNQNLRLSANYEIEFHGKEAFIFKRKTGLFSSADIGGGAQ